MNSYSQVLKMRGKIVANEEVVEDVIMRVYAVNNKLLAKLHSLNGYYQCDLPYYNQYIVHVEKKGYTISPVLISTKVPMTTDWHDMWRVFHLDLDLEEFNDTIVYMSKKVQYNPRKNIYFEESSRTPTIIGEYMNNTEAERPYKKINQLVKNAYENPAFDRMVKDRVEYDRYKVESKYNALSPYIKDNNSHIINDGYFDNPPVKEIPKPKPEPVAVKPNYKSNKSSNSKGNKNDISNDSNKSNSKSAKKTQPKVHYNNEANLEKLWAWIQQVEENYDSAPQSKFHDKESERRIRGASNSENITVQGKGNNSGKGVSDVRNNSNSRGNSNISKGTSPGYEGIYYTINIGVYQHRKKKFNDVYGSIGQYLVNTYNGLSYHSIGKFNSIQQVDRYISKVREFVPEAFITAWNKKKRMPVEEAKKLTDPE